MKKFILPFFMALMGSFGLSAQIVFEDFEGGTSDLPWAAADGIYNGVIPNPGKDAVNGSDYVGSYTKGAGFGYSLFWVPALAQPLDLSQYNQFKLKVWCSTATEVLLKFEGGGKGIEKKVLMPAANQWVDLEFDMSGGASYTGLTKIIIFFDPGVDASSNTYYFDDLVAYKAERFYETFETPSGITWTSLNGAYNGAILNPGPNQVNSSATVGSFSNAPAFDYNFAFGALSAPMDLSVFNQFKIQLWAPKATQLLFKLEGGGKFIEKTINIAVANAWQEYTVDFSGAKDFTTLDKILIVFSPGVTGSSDTYYIDNIYAVPNACAGNTPNTDVLDDFECNRNASYGFGWDSLYVINNPDPTGNNTSAKVGKFYDPAGLGTEYASLLIDYENPIDLSTKNIFSCKVWSPKAGDLLLKIEGGGGAKELKFPVTELNKWVEYTVDFADQAGKGRNKFVIFFNAGVNGEPGDVYYIDDIKLSAPTSAPPIEDFQGTAKLFWAPLSQDQTVHGVFTGPTDNPKPNTVNNTTQVGCYSKGTSAFSTLQAFSLTPFDLTQFPQFNLDVLSPAGGGTVRMVLSSITAGNKEVDVKVKTPGEWETLNFDYTNFKDVADFYEVLLIFNPETAAQGESWCIDNLRQGLATVDPCADVVPNLNIVDDFECQRNYTDIFYGKSDIKAVNNPKPDGTNGSLKVGEYTDPAGNGSEYAGIGFQFPNPPDLSTYNQLQFQIYSETAGIPCLIKLQGGQFKEFFDTIDVAKKWVKQSVDFSSAKDGGNNQLVIFVNAGVPGGGTYLIDNIRFTRAGYNGCVSDYETLPTSFDNFLYFNNGSYNKPFESVDNPLKAGINTSNKVGKFVQAADANKFAGMYMDLESPIDFKGNKQVKVKVLMDHIGSFTVKAEIFGNTFPPVEVTVPNTKTNEWEELTFDFSAVKDGDEYPRFTIFVDLGSETPGADRVTYFDDIVIGKGACGAVGVFNPQDVAALKVSPNPVTDMLQVDNFDNVARMDVFNLFGQRIASTITTGETRVSIDVSRFPAGMYTLAGYNKQGGLVGNAKFIKQ